MFSKAGSEKKNEFLGSTKAARAERQHMKKKDQAAIIIQTQVRGFLVKRRVRKKFCDDLDQMLNKPPDDADEYKPTFISAVDTFKIIRKFLFVFKEKEDQLRFEYLCRYLLASLDNENTKIAYISVALSKNHVLPWIQQLKDILWVCCHYIANLKLEVASDMRMINSCLRMLVTFTSTSGWKIFKGKNGEALRPGMNQLCSNVMGHLNNKGLYPSLQALLMKGLARSKPVFKPVTLSAIITVSLRPLIAAQFSDKLLILFMLHVFSVPGLVLHISNLTPECLAVLMTHRIFRKCIDLLSNEQSTKIIFNTLEGNYALCLLANLIQLGDSEMEGLVESTANFIFVVTRLLESCQQYVLSKKSNMPHWHPVLGWFSQKTDQSLHEAMPFVVKQLQLLWKIKMIKILFSDLISHNDIYGKSKETSKSSPTKNPFKKAFEKASSKQPTFKINLDSPLMMSTFAACALYRTSLKTLTQLRLDILAGLSCEDLLLPHLWRFLCELGPHCGLKVYLEVLSSTPNVTTHGLFDMLTLACEASSHIITILDDIELYEQQKPFKLEQFVSISHFLNQFIYKVIWNNLIDVKSAANNDVFLLVHSLLMILYERDCRRRYTPADHWLIKDIKPSSFFLELEKGKSIAEYLLQKVPHIIPHKERVILFRKFVMKEKADLGLTESLCTSPQSTLITVHRSRILEDGYRQLAQLSVNNLKGVIRVKFVNEQGLDEAGIDQDGVFKEFLEETISRVFDPSLNLFKVTSEQKLYPSPTSYIQENHLHLFEFVGRMLAKAVYEGIVVEVPFASFFLSQILGHQYSATYSFIDELPSLDAELYKSLTYIKHYEGDISDLDLTFSCDEDVLGKLVTHELVPGGKVIAVTNDNKISYVHLMAHFRMRTQIKEQTKAFIRGFKSIVNKDWLTMFSTPELQKLISGDTMDIDLDDLKKHTQYYGGFHSNHRVVNWLWDLLEHDFSPQERGQFLKFVTSCSKPPLLGFAHLEPPFSIRCVEVSDEQDTGDTVGSVLKGFFNIRKKDPVGRLPTSSTCFNLLKLPNYQQKSTLKAKLRYAITSNTGFELS